MKSSSKQRRNTCVALVVGALAFGFNQPLALARSPSIAISSVAHFDETTWARLVEKGPRPAAYIFTTTYCSTCPDAFEKLRSFVMDAHRPVELAAVMMDVQGVRAVEHARHYLGLTRLYAFEGFEPAIRQSVDPKWPNVTPYVVLVARDGSLQRSIGAPDAAMLKKWLP